MQADPGQLEQILMNLALNARDAMPEGGTLTIETKNTALDEAYAEGHAEVTAGEYVLLAISDSGTGIDAKTQARMFEPFFTTKPVGKGTGLGLSTVYGIVRQSGGHIWVYSEEGRGTTFKVYFPRTSTPASPRVEPAPSAPVAPANQTVLLVEDEEAVRQAAVRVLRHLGYHVLAAATAEEARSFAAHHAGPIHVMLTDVVMPKVSGPALATELAEVRPQMKVVFMSGYTGNSMSHEAGIQEGALFLDKPFSPATLSAKLREALDQAK